MGVVEVVCRKNRSYGRENVEHDQSKQPRSGLAIAGLVLGIIALLTSLMPIINNMSFFVALVGAVLAIVGLVACMRGKRAGKGLAVAAIVVNVISVAAVIASQGMYSAAIDDAMNGPQAVQESQSEDAAGDEVDESKVDESVGEKRLSVGASVELSNGMTVSVDEVVPGLANYDGTTVTGVRVTYVNNSDEALSFNSYDWKGESASGVQSDATYYSEATEELSYGDLSAGGTVSGYVYFDGDLSNVLYFSSPFADGPAATWGIA